MLLLDAHRQLIDPVTRGVGFGLFDHAFERQFNPGPPAYDQADPILNDAAEARNFVGSDSRRFYVRLCDDHPAAPGTLPDGRRFVMARWYTRDGEGRVLDENGGTSEITLAEVGPGVFESAALLLVAWEEDRDLQPHSGVDGRYPSGSELRGPGSSDHRVRLGCLDGDLVISYPDEPELVAHSFLPAERRRLPLCLFVGSTSGLGEPVTTPDEVFGTSLHRATRIYASIGIGVETAPHPVAEALLSAGDRRIRRVSQGPRQMYYVVDGPALFGRRAELGRLSADTFASFCRQFPNRDRTVRVLYVAGFDDGKFGMAYPDCDFPRQLEAGACACQAERYPERAIMAHEVGHILTDKSSQYGIIADQTNGFCQMGGHFSRPANPPDNRFLHFYNLMGGSRYRLYDVDVVEASPGGRARTFNQYRDIRTSPYVK